MNKKPLVVVLILLFVVLAGVAVFLFAGKLFAPREEVILDQTSNTFLVKGDVKINKISAGGGWHKLEASTVIEKGDVIETAGESTADIVIGANTDKAIKIGEKSIVEFEGINPTSLNFSKGKLLVNVKRLEPKSSFVVKTPTAICGARGTGWMEEASPGMTKVCVFDNSVFVRELNDAGKPKMGKRIANQGTELIIQKGVIIKEVPLGELDAQVWQSWAKNVEYLREGKVLVNDFDRKENFNNLSGPFGSWNVFFSDPSQYCRDEFTVLERVGEKGYALKLTYDVETSFSAYNGFFTNLMGIDISGYKYLVFSIKGDKIAGFTTSVNVELKNMRQTGRAKVDGITSEWKRIVLPLKDFVGINTFKDMKEIVVVFSDIAVTKKVGVVYIDDIYFAKYDPDVKGE
ncbi:MAG: FecR domain-containing protein [Candidatus Omnitrophica bacterium]|nr:FecR domain-containing protein [Candidatus Omnitrophota bacterium]